MLCFGLSLGRGRGSCETRELDRFVWRNTKPSNYVDIATFHLAMAAATVAITGQTWYGGLARKRAVRLGDDKHQRVTPAKHIR